jgi:SAM-dependent methyltransferase
MGADESPRYGSVEWFVDEYARVVDDPWGLSWRPSQKLRYLHTLELLDKIDRPIKSIIDIGCATGEVTCLLSKKYSNASIVGIDFTESAIRRAKAKYANLQFRVGSILQVGQQFKEEIDLALCLEVLYYIGIADQSRALDSVWNALCPGGYALFSSFRGEPPYLSNEDLINLASARGFRFVGDVTIYVTPLTRLERFGMKIDKLGPRMKCPWLSTAVRKTAGSFPIGMAHRIEDLGRRWFSRFAASHCLVLVQK